MYGISWLLLGGIFCISGAIAFQETAFGGLLVLIGIGVCIGGILYVHHGYTHHEVHENKDE